MSYTGMEESHLTYYKLLDGLGMFSGGVACDLSFNSFVTAKYLAEKHLFDTVYSMADSRMIIQDRIQPVKVDQMLAVVLRKLRVNTHICLGGAFRLQPVHDIVYALQASLVVGGKLIIAAYPSVYDSQGRDVLMMLSQLAHNPVQDKLKRWSVTLDNAIHNLFVNVKSEEIITDAGIGEVITLFGSENFKKYLFKNNAEFETFFAPLSRNQKYYFSWNLSTSIRL